MKAFNRQEPFLFRWRRADEPARRVCDRHALPDARRGGVRRRRRGTVGRDGLGVCSRRPGGVSGRRAEAGLPARVGARDRRGLQRDGGRRHRRRLRPGRGATRPLERPVPRRLRRGLRRGDRPRHVHDRGGRPRRRRVSPVRDRRARRPVRAAPVERARVLSRPARRARHDRGRPRSGAIPPARPAREGVPRAPLHERPGPQGPGSGSRRSPRRRLGRMVRRRRLHQGRADRELRGRAPADRPPGSRRPARPRVGGGPDRRARVRARLAAPHVGRRDPDALLPGHARRRERSLRRRPRSLATARGRRLVRRKRSLLPIHPAPARLPRGTAGIAGEPEPRRAARRRVRAVLAGLPRCGRRARRPVPRWPGNTSSISRTRTRATRCSRSPRSTSTRRPSGDPTSSSARPSSPSRRRARRHCSPCHTRTPGSTWSGRRTGRRDTSRGPSSATR